MRVAGRFQRRFICFIGVMVFFVSAAFAEAKGKTEEEKTPVGLVDVKACEGVEITQCELAKNLINTLKMGQDLTCEACFIHLQALGIAPGEDWNYEDPHRVVSVEEITEVALEVHGAYNDGIVRFDGFEAAAGVNRFCQDMKGPSATPAPSETERQEAKTKAVTETKTEKEGETEKETSATPPSQNAREKGPAPAEAAEQGKTPPAAGAEESGTNTEEYK